MSLSKALLYTTAYIFVHAFFGLAPLWLIFDATLYNFKIHHGDLIKEGVVMFFCITIIGVISFDYGISEKKHKSDVIKYLTIVIPFILLTLVAINFLQLRSVSDNFDYSNIKTLQFGLVILTLIYCLIIKTFLYINETGKK